MRTKNDVFQGYKDKVVDLSRKNRLLNFPKTAKSITFLYSLNEFEKQFGSENSIHIDFFHKEILKEETDKNGEKILIEDEVDEIHTVPQTDLKGMKLSTTLESFRLETKRKYEEHGLYTLFLTIGFVQWKEPLAGKGSSDRKKTYDYNAPLLLIPIELIFKQHPKRTTIINNFEAGDLQVNSILSMLLEREFLAEKLHLPNEDTVTISLLFEHLRKQLETTFLENHISFHIDETVQIGQYSFYGEQIYKDLATNQDAFLEHPFINALCSHTPIRQKEKEQVNPDALLTEQNDFNILDADSSQLHIIQEVISGKHLLIQGPPGTGKSQTIVNVISNLLARNKKVLVVCEKQVALDVVYKRLKEKGIDKLCLPLFQISQNRRNFARSIIDDGNAIIDAPLNTSITSLLQDREQHIKALTDYAKELGTIVKPLNKSIYWIHGELAKHLQVNENKPFIWKGEDILSTTYETYKNILRILDDMKDIFNTPLTESHRGWSILHGETFPIDFTNRVEDVFEELQMSLRDAITIALSHNETKTIQDVVTLLGKKEIFEGLKNVGENISKKLEIARAIETLTEYSIRLNQFNDGGSNNSIQLVASLPDNPFPEDTISLLLPDTSLDILDDAFHALQSLQKELSTIVAIRDESRLRHFSLKEIVENKKFILSGSLILSLKDWQTLSVLQSALTQLATLKTLLTSLQDRKHTLDTWGILLPDINDDTMLLLCERIMTKYKSPLRNINNQYKTDTKSLTQICYAKTPNEYEEFTQIASAIDSYVTIYKKYEKLLNNFLNEHMISGTNLTQNDIYHLAETIELIIQHTEKHGTIDEKVFTIITDKQTLQELQEFAPHLQEIYNYHSDIQELFHSDTSHNVITLNTIVNQTPLFLNTLVQTITLNKEVQNCLPQKYLPQTVDQLHESIHFINKQIYKLHVIQTPQFADLFIDFTPNLITKDLQNILDIEKKLSQLKVLKKLCNQLHKNNPNLTLEEALVYIESMQKEILKWQTWYDHYLIIKQKCETLIQNPTIFSKFEEIHTESYLKEITQLLSDISGIEEWMKYRRYAYQLEKYGLAWFLEKSSSTVIEHPVSFFAVTFWTSWLAIYYMTIPALNEFTVEHHQETLEQFKKLDKDILSINAERVLSEAKRHLQEKSIFSFPYDQNILHQSQLKRNHMPVRKLVRKSGTQLINIKPCWMTSPLTLSSYVPYKSIHFDTIIFDEASQMRVEHALGAIARANQIVIFGDENQLPPTSFFSNQHDETLQEIESDENDTIDIFSEDYESILNASKEILPDASDMLRYHYRSKYEDLIAFSNHTIYNDKLITFPSPTNLHKGIQFEYVPDGVFQGGKEGNRSNEKEADRVAELCIAISNENPTKTLGIIAFSKSQENAIREALQNKLKLQEILSDRFDEGSTSTTGFFIKNLESVQGDERDIILLSIGYGKNKEGKVMNRFGPLNGQDGYRRLNVAITRAKEKIICISSMRAGDIQGDSQARGVQLLKQYLEFIDPQIEKSSMRITNTDTTINSFDSPFEEEVASALEELGYEIATQVGASGYKIDLAIKNPNNTGEYVLGIECDGASYHSTYSARINDRIRQDNLERLGWDLYRIWSQHWIHDKSTILDDIQQKVTQKISLKGTKS